MCLSVKAESFSILVDDTDGIEIAAALLFKEGDRNDDFLFFCKLGEVFQGFGILVFLCKIEAVVVFDLAEVVSFEKFLKKDQVCTFLLRFLDEGCFLLDVLIIIVRTAHLT